MLEKRRVIGRTIISAMTLSLALTSGIVSASEDADGGAAARKIVVRDDDLISPSALTMSRNDLLEFENHSGQFVRLVFVAPDDQADKIRCHPVDHPIAGPDRTPWPLFDWGPGSRLTATMPPGKFASVCSLAPGRYAFVAWRMTGDPHGVNDSLGTKGTITVQ